MKYSFFIKNLFKKNQVVFQIIGVVFFICLSLFLSISSFKNKSITTDENWYIFLSKEVLSKWWEQDALIDHPPLTFYIQGLPSFLFPDNEKIQNNTLFYSRLIMQIILLLFLLVIFIIANKNYGIKSAFLALLLSSLNPQLLAHARLITLDFNLTVFVLISLASFYDFIKSPKFFNTFKLGIFLGLTFLTKYPGLLLIPINIFSLIFVKKRFDFKIIFKFSITVIIALFMVNVGYGFKGSLNLPNKFKSKTIIKISKNRIGKLFLRVFPENYLKGLDSQLNEYKQGFYTMYLFGQTKRRETRWYYFAFAFLIKTSVPLLILILLFFIFGKKSFLEKYVLFVIAFLFLSGGI